MCVEVRFTTEIKRNNIKIDVAPMPGTPRICPLLKKFGKVVVDSA